MRPDRTRLNVALPKNVNLLNIQSVAHFVQDKAVNDPQFLAELRADPVKVFMDHGLNRKLAIELVADWVGNPVASCLGTCGCTGCTSKNGIIDKSMFVLPTARDTAGWATLLNSRATKITR